MKTRLTLMLTALLWLTLWSSRADETITVTASNGDISQNLDLKAVATVFGEAKDLEEFEQLLNDPEQRISNLDLNGDGRVDYLRVIETTNDDVHLVVLQAILAKDIYQDVASILVERDEKTQQVVVQIVGDEYIYGQNYVIEPIYIHTPVIYDWFWGPTWVVWNSPWYWGYYPSYWYAYDCWLVHDYWHYMYDYHHFHPYCSYRYRPEPDPHFRGMHDGVGRHDYADSHRDQTFSQRNNGSNNARDLQPTRQTRNADNSRQANSATGNGSRTFGSQNVRSAASTTRVAGSTATQQSNGSRTAQSRATATATRSSSNASTASRETTTASRSTTATATRSNSTASRTSSSTTTARSTSSSAQRSTSSSSTTSRSTTARTTPSTTSRATAPTQSRTSSYSSGMRTSSGTNSARTSSSMGGSSRSTGSVAPRSTGSASSRGSAGGGASRTTSGRR